jgi:hypothetical protein
VANWDINGLWAGEYSYDPHPALPPDRPDVRFTLTAVTGWFGHITGTVEDDPEHGIPVAAALDGKVSGTTVTFQKQYPVFYVTDWDGQMRTLRERLRNQGIWLDEDVLPPPVRYRGEYDPEEMEIHGTWAIGSRRITVRSEGRTFTIEAPGCTGTWWMRRQYRSTT